MTRGGASRIRLPVTVIVIIVLISGAARAARAQSDPIFEDDFDTLNTNVWTIIPPSELQTPCVVKGGALSGSCWLESVESFEPGIGLEMRVMPSSAFVLLLGWLDDDNCLAVQFGYSYMPEMMISSTSCRINGESISGMGFDHPISGKPGFGILWVSWSHEGLHYFLRGEEDPFGGSGIINSAGAEAESSHRRALRP